MSLSALVALLAAASPVAGHDLVMFDTAKPPEAVTACLRSGLSGGVKGGSASVQVEPFSQSKANRAWYVRFRLKTVSATITVTPGPQGSYVVYPRYVGQVDEALATAIEDCG